MFAHNPSSAMTASFVGFPVAPVMRTQRPHSGLPGNRIYSSWSPRYQSRALTVHDHSQGSTPLAGQSLLFLPDGLTYGTMRLTCPGTSILEQSTFPVHDFLNK